MELPVKKKFIFTYLNPIFLDVEFARKILTSEDIRVVRATEGNLQLIQLQVAKGSPGAFGLLWLIDTALCISMAGVSRRLSICVISTLIIIIFVPGM